MIVREVLIGAAIVGAIKAIASRADDGERFSTDEAIEVVYASVALQVPDASEAETMRAVLSIQRGITATYSGSPDRSPSIPAMLDEPVLSDA
jgi:hypothetical protein